MNDGMNSEVSNQESLNYKFDNEGSYEITLTVVDNNGGSSTSGTLFIFVTAKTNTGGGGNDEEEEIPLLIGGGIAGILALCAVVGLKYFRNEDE